MMLETCVATGLKALRMKRLNRALLITSFIPFCWLAFMTIHELGHVVAGLLTGGSVNRVVIHPLALSRTDVSPNPSPLITAWAGPVIGVLLPVTIWSAFWKCKLPGDHLTRFFAGFCLIANGLYIGIGSLEKVGDAGEMVQHGTPIWMLWIFGIITVPIGFLTWHQLGPRFGWGESEDQVDATTALISVVLFAVLLLATTSLSPRI